MKNILTLFAFLTVGASFGQLELNQFNWDDPGFYKNSGNPFVRGYGDLSDSLSALTNDEIDYYYHHGKYFAISTWADYYHWFTSKFWYRFGISTDVYKFHYLTGNNIEMMRFLFNEF
ncbi:MAG: hypothetical protein HRT61_11910 [Ekhidna sp.]|nr:hypothetical protein [Ekhidna sp.]